MRNRVAEFLSPVDHIPGHSQHASHPGAAHHPATHKQGSDIDRLEAENCSNIEVDRLHEVLKAETERSGFYLRRGQKYMSKNIINSVYWLL